MKGVSQFQKHTACRRELTLAPLSLALIANLEHICKLRARSAVAVNWAAAITQRGILY
jgi:hypothetical protein